MTKFDYELDKGLEEEDFKESDHFIESDYTIEGFFTYEDFKRIYEKKLNIKLESWLRDTFHNKKEYKAVFNYIRGIARKFGWSYEKRGFDWEDARQECFLKLMELKEQGKLKEHLETNNTLKSKTGQTKEIYGKLGFTLKNHLINYINHEKLDPLYTAYLIPGEKNDLVNYNSGELYDVPSTIDVKTYRNPRIYIEKEPDQKEEPSYNPDVELAFKRSLIGRKKTEGTPYIKKSVIALRAFDMEDSGQLIATSNTKTHHRYIIGYKAFDTDVMDKIDLIKSSIKIIKELKKLRDSEFTIKLFLAELKTGCRSHIPLYKVSDIEAQKAYRRFNVRTLARVLNTWPNTNKIKRHGKRLYEYKMKQEHVYQKQLLDDMKVNKNSPEYREFEAYWKACLTNKVVAYWTGK